MSENIGNQSRIMRYLVITVGVAFLAYVSRTICSMLLTRISLEMSALIPLVAFVINVLAAIVAASRNRRKTFCSVLSWWLAVPVMAVLELLFNMLGSYACRPVMEAVLSMAPPMEMGAWLRNVSIAVNLIQFALWAVLSYLFQRFVLYRDTLDTNGLTQR